ADVRPPLLRPDAAISPGIGGLVDALHRDSPSSSTTNASRSSALFHRSAAHRRPSTISEGTSPWTASRNDRVSVTAMSSAGVGARGGASERLPARLLLGFLPALGQVALQPPPEANVVDQAQAGFPPVRPNMRLERVVHPGHLPEQDDPPQRGGRIGLVAVHG